MPNNKPILLVEDDQIDVMMVRRALKELKINNELIHAGNGEDALNYLQKPDNPNPWLILLDINMPIMNGPKFLKVVKKDPAARTIPIVIFTSSEEQQDKEIAFNMGAAGYMLKPVKYEKLLETINIINTYWALSELPDPRKFTNQCSLNQGLRKP